LHPDLIFFTGDLAWGQIKSEPGLNLRDQFSEGHEFLEAVRQSFDPIVPQENVFIVPGNHDVDRNAATIQLTDWLEKQTKGEEVAKMIAGGGRDWLQYVARLDQYKEFLAKHGYSHLLKRPDHLIYSATRDVAGRKIGIAGFNSAWSCCHDK